MPLKLKYQPSFLIKYLLRMPLNPKMHFKSISELRYIDPVQKKKNPNRWNGIGRVAAAIVP